MQTTYLSGGKPVGIDVFVPSGAGKYPIVLALHGSSGLHSSSTQFPQLLADRGFAVFLPHFFDTTGTTWAGPLTIREKFPQWTIAISDALDFAQDHPQSDRGQIGIVGFSLGAYLGLSLGSQQSRVKALSISLADCRTTLPSRCGICRRCLSCMAIATRWCR